MKTNNEIIKKYDLEGDGDLGIDVNEALNDARADTAKQIFKKLDRLMDEVSRANPYPEAVFIEPTDAQLKKAVNAIIKTGITSDSIHGSWGRKVWNLCLNRIRGDEWHDGIRELKKKYNIEE